MIFPKQEKFGSGRRYAKWLEARCRARSASFTSVEELQGHIDAFILASHAIRMDQEEGLPAAVQNRPPYHPAVIPGTSVNAGRRIDLRSALIAARSPIFNGTE